MSFAIRTSQESFHATDHSAMHTHISNMGTHLREGFASANKAFTFTSLKSKGELRSIILAGMGGSAIAGDFIRSYLFDSLSIPFVVSRGYDLPQFAHTNSLIIIASYSGDTEESLSQYEQAKKLGLPVIAITTGGTLKQLAERAGDALILIQGGLQPRAALAYSLAPLLWVLTTLGYCPDQTKEIELAALKLEEMSTRYGPEHLDDSNIAYSAAQHLMHRIPVVYTDNRSMEAVGLRWRGQLQENAKHVAFGNVLPEMNHNEINGWNHPLDVLQHLSVIFLRNKQDEHPRVAKRFDVTKEILLGKSVMVQEFEAEGESRLARMFSLIALGDWISLYLAVLTGIDPTPVPSIDLLKKSLKG